MASKINGNSALIDNSTISGVERLIGASKVKNLNNTDHDIVCFEKMICAILFFDNWHLIDDYKPYYSNKRKNLFSFIEPILLTTNEYKNHSKTAAEYAADKIFSLKNQEPVDDTLKFFNQLQLSPQMRWDVFVSSEYLTLSYLIEDNYDKHTVGTKLAAFGNEFSDCVRTQNSSPSQPKIYDKSHELQNENYLPEELDEFVSRLRANPNSKGTGHQDTLNSIIFGYGWVAERSKFYETVAQSHGVSCILSPLRDSFSLAALDIWPTSYEQNFLSSADSIVKKAVINVSKAADLTAVTFIQPLFTSWLLSKVNNATEALNYALELREWNLFTEARNQFRELSLLSATEKKKEINRLLSAITKTSEAILKEFCVETPNGPSVSLGISLAGPSVSFSNSLDKLFGRSSPSKSPIVRTYRSLARDLVAVERLGSIHEKITSQLNISEDSVPGNFSTTPRFMRRRANEYGKPA